MGNESSKRKNSDLDNHSKSDQVSPQKKPSYRWDDGRRFHDVKDSFYCLPNDDEEMDRLHTKHWILKHLFKGTDTLAPVSAYCRNFKAPIEDVLTQYGTKVLDVGCGPGTWCLDMAETYTIPEFYGVDISAVFPEAIYPANCHFEVANVLETLPFPSGIFDFVQMRCLSTALTESQWPIAIKELKRVCKPGGWIQLLEMNPNVQSPGPLFKEFNSQAVCVCETLNVSIGIAPKLKDMLIDSGLESVHKTVTSIPMGWGGRLGQAFRENIREIYISAKPWMSKSFGIYDQEYDRCLDEAMSECVDYRAYYDWHIVWGRRPDDEGFGYLDRTN